MQFDNKNKPVGAKRLYLATKNSVSAFKWLLKNEAAFKQECILLILLTPVSLLFNISKLHHLLLIITLLFVLFTEVINTAIEAVVDRISLEMHPLSGLAKDLGSAAVLISLLTAILTWSVILWPQ